MVKTERLFIAAPLPDPFKIAAASWQNELKADLSFRKWVHPDDLHITLKFLGHVEGDLVQRIQNAMREVCIMYVPFSLHLGALGTFGKKGAPSILYASVHGGLESLERLQRSTEDAVVHIIHEEPENRPYKPHLTLARSFNGTNGWKADRLNDHKPAEELQTPWLVDRLVLYRSHLERVPMYESVAEFSLKAAIPIAKAIQ